jgi:hypothetical protein
MACSGTALLLNKFERKTLKKDCVQITFTFAIYQLHCPVKRLLINLKVFYLNPSKASRKCDFTLGLIVLCKLVYATYICKSLFSSLDLQQLQWTLSKAFSSETSSIQVHITMVPVLVIR